MLVINLKRSYMFYNSMCYFSLLASSDFPPHWLLQELSVVNSYKMIFFFNQEISQDLSSWAVKFCVFTFLKYNVHVSVQFKDFRDGTHVGRQLQDQNMRSYQCPRNPLILSIISTILPHKDNHCPGF